MTVGKICQRHVDLAGADDLVEDAADRMLQRCVGTLVVVDKESRPEGIITDRDLALRVLAAGLEPAGTFVGDVMTTPAKTVTLDTPIEEALSLMRRESVRRLPVVDREGKLVGLVSLDDVLRLLAEEFATIESLITRESPEVLASVRPPPRAR
jgi:CBS domain-containing protein